MPKSAGSFSWGNTTVDTACPLDCPDSCSLTVTLEKGKILEIDGSERQETTGGYICATVRRFAERVYGDARLRYPAIRNGAKGEGRFKRVAWDEALDTIATRITEIKNRWGGEAILPFSYGGSNGLLTQDTTDARLFRRLGTSRLTRTVCRAPTSAASQALYGKMPSVAYTDYPHARLIVIWGANPSTSGIHLVPYIREAQRRGAALVVIDPRRTPLARHADLHLAVKPGTDVVVALALHRHLFENGLADERFLDEHTRGARHLRDRSAQWTIDRAAAVAGIHPDDLRRFAELYAHSSPAVIRLRLGSRAQPQRRECCVGDSRVAGRRREIPGARRWLHDEQFGGVEPLIVRLDRLGRAADAPGQYEPPGSCASRLRRSARQTALCLQLQPGGDDARSEPGNKRPAA